MHGSAIPLLWALFIGVSLAAPAISPVTLSQFMNNVKSNTTDSFPLLPLIPIHPSIPELVIIPPSNSALTNYDDDTYNVPGTDITLDIGYWPHRDIDHHRLGTYLREMQDEIMTHIQVHGDSSLGAFNGDPYRRSGVGFYFIVKSTALRTEQGQKMTYQFLLDVLVGLYHVLYDGMKPWAAYCNIDHKTLGLLGTAVVLPSDPVHLEVATS